MALVEQSDLVTSLFARLGNTGLVVLACALILAGLGGAAVAHRLDYPPSHSAASKHPGIKTGASSHQQDRQDDKIAKQESRSEQAEQGEHPAHSKARPTPKPGTPD